MFSPPPPPLPKGSPDKEWLKKWDRGFAIIQGAMTVTGLVFVGLLIVMTIVHK